MPRHTLITDQETLNPVACRRGQTGRRLGASKTGGMQRV